MAERAPRDPDQAEGLRRLFGPAPVRIAPMLVERGCIGAQVAALDAARAQFAAALGLRARFDLLHVQRGECLLDQALLDAGPGLAVLPLARVAASARHASDVCAQALALTGAAFAADLVLLLFDAEQATLLAEMAGAEVVVVLPPERAAWPRLLGALGAVADNTDIAAFRLLFPAWEAESAARLHADMARAGRARLRPELRFGGAVPVARDWKDVARASTEWALARLPRPHHVRTF